MVARRPTRRAILGGLAVLATAGPGLAETIVDLAWKDLLPEGETPVPQDLQSLLPHDENAMAAGQPASSGVRTDWNGQIVRMSGFIVPIDFDGTGVTAFILVPYVGACVHVPPPPANQLVLVTASEPYPSDRLFEAVTVTGMFGTAATSTQLADIGYALSAEDIEPFRY